LLLRPSQNGRIENLEFVTDFGLGLDLLGTGVCVCFTFSFT